MNMHNKKNTQNNIHSPSENTEHNLTLSVLGKIHEEKICPKNKGYFVFRDISLWTPGILVTIIGAFAWAGVIFSGTQSSFKYREFISPKALPFIARELPTVWVIAFLVFALLTIKAFRQTKRGYKYNTTTVLGVSVVVSFVLGLIIVKSDIYYRNPFLRFPTERIQKQMWFNPEEGRIVGMVTKTDTGSFVLLDKNKKVWTLDTTEVSMTEETLTQNTLIRIVGRAQNDSTFLVCMVVPRATKPIIERTKLILKEQKKTFTECHSVLQEIREHHRERKNKLHP